MRNGLRFSDERPVRPTAFNRVDVACFVGLVALREGVAAALPGGLSHWLQTRGWLPREGGAPGGSHRPSAAELLDVPVPVDDWDTFDRLFAWENRVIADGVNAPTYLGCAVRAFFTEGGRRCYVVRMADPLPWLASAADRDAHVRLLTSPGLASASDRASWHGIAHLFGLPDVSFLGLPDLPDLLRSPAPAPDVTPPPVFAAPEQFVDCTPPARAAAADAAVRTVPAPRSDRAALGRWRDAVRAAASFIAERRREVQLVVSLPLPSRGDSSHADTFGFMSRRGWLADDLDEPGSLASSFVQLTYPWLQTITSGALPGGVEPPDGRLLGLLARNALSRGTFRSVTALDSAQVIDVLPRLRAATLYAERDAAPSTRFVDRISTFAPTPAGIRLVSDVSSSNSASYRAAAVGRTMAFIIRTARQLGEEVVFDVSGPALWQQVRDRLENFLLALFHLGALDGTDAADAFSVRCDRSTMSRQDIDNGRVIAHVAVRPVAAIETIEVALTLDAGDTSSRVGSGAALLEGTG